MVLHRWPLCPKPVTSVGCAVHTGSITGRVPVRDGRDVLDYTPGRTRPFAQNTMLPQPGRERNNFVSPALTGLSDRATITTVREGNWYEYEVSPREQAQGSLFSIHSHSIFAERKSRMSW